MGFTSSLRHLWRHRSFRRLLAVRIATQSADGVLQIALVSYVLFSPQQQPDAASIATVLAITLLPFSVLGPFVSVVLDRWSRRQILVVVDLTRAAVAVGLAAMVATGLRDGVVQTAFYGGVLLAMSLNRLLLAALSASLPHTIDPGEYLVANAVVPTVGPAGALVGAGVALGLRLLLGQVWTDYQANAILFLLAAGGFGLSVLLALRIPRDRLGPDDVEPAHPREVVTGLGEALRHLADRRAAGLGLITIGAHRIVYGLVTVAMILVYRNYFHTVDEVEAALADLGVLLAVTGVGFVAASVVTPFLTTRLGVRRTVVVCLVASAVVQIVPGAIFVPGALVSAGFLLGLGAQVIKICVDTLVQAHVDDDLKGRVFVLYDMVFNVALVLAAVLAAVILPPNGASVVVLVGLAGCYLLFAVLFSRVSRSISMDEGTESLVSARSDMPTAGRRGDPSSQDPV